MAGTTASSNKAKIARRVVEVLEFFDDVRREATVMDIVRRYNRPQSSTSELLGSLVELGLLIKHEPDRTYTLAPRAALLGTAGQSDAIRDGRIVRLMDELRDMTGLSIVLLSMVQLDAQVISWRQGVRDSVALRDICAGAKELLVRSAPGMLLLSKLERHRCEGMVRRMNAEAKEANRFSSHDMLARIDACRSRQYVVGGLGFDTELEAICALLPSQPRHQPLAVAIAYGPDESVKPEILMRCIRDSFGEPASFGCGSSNIQFFRANA